MTLTYRYLRPVPKKAITNQLIPGGALFRPLGNRRKVNNDHVASPVTDRLLGAVGGNTFLFAGYRNNLSPARSYIEAFTIDPTTGAMTQGRQILYDTNTAYQSQLVGVSPNGLLSSAGRYISGGSVSFDIKSHSTSSGTSISSSGSPLLSNITSTSSAWHDNNDMFAFGTTSNTGVSAANFFTVTNGGAIATRATGPVFANGYCVEQCWVGDHLIMATTVGNADWRIRFHVFRRSDMALIATDINLGDDLAPGNMAHIGSGRILMSHGRNNTPAFPGNAAPPLMTLLQYDGAGGLTRVGETAAKFGRNSDVSSTDGVPTFGYHAGSGVILYVDHYRQQFGFRVIGNSIVPFAIPAITFLSGAKPSFVATPVGDWFPIADAPTQSNVSYGQGLIGTTKIF